AKVSASGLVSVDGSAVTQPVSGPTAVGSANANPPVIGGGTVTGAAGQNVVGVAVKPASTAPLATDTSLVVGINPNSVNPNGQATMANSVSVAIASNQSPIPVTGSFSATGFQSNGIFANLTATASSSASTALPSGATSVRITNAGSGTVSCTFAIGAATGVVNNIQVGPSSSVSRAVGSYDHIACIDQTGSSGSQLVVIEGGSG